jgi:hypothetical protein
VLSIVLLVLQGEKGRVDAKAAAKDAPPAGKELPNSPVGSSPQKK